VPARAARAPERHGVLIEVGATYAGGLLALSLAQRRLLFGRPRPVRGIAAGPHAAGLERQTVSLRVDGGVVLRGWFAQPADPARRLATLLYFAGRNEHPGWAPEMASHLPGWSVYAFAYRGTCGSGGRPGEREAVADAVAVHAFAQRQGSGLPQPMAIMGRSLGTGVAVQLAARVAPVRLVLLSPYDSVAALVARNLVLRPGAGLLRHRFESIRHAASVRCPTLVLLAHEDRRVPVAHSLRLAAALGGPVQTCLVPGSTHRSLPRSDGAQSALRRFLLPPLPAGVAPAD